MSKPYEPSYCLECFNYFWGSSCEHPTDEVWAERNRIITLLEKHKQVSLVLRVGDKSLDVIEIETAIAFIKGENK